MSVESYLDSIRQNTQKGAMGSSDVNSTMKELLNFEALRRAISMGTLDGTRLGFDKLNELSLKIINANACTTAEMKQVHKLLKDWYDSQKSSANGKIPVQAQAMVAGLKSVLDEFGDKLPEKFQNMLKNDLARTAVAGGLDPTTVLQVIESDLTDILIYMKEKDKVLEREKLEEKQKEALKAKSDRDFWGAALGKITDILGKVVAAITPIIGWMALLYAGMQLWKNYGDQIKDWFNHAKDGASKSFTPGGGTYNKLHEATTAAMFGNMFSKMFSNLGKDLVKGKYGEGAGKFYKSLYKTNKNLVLKAGKMSKALDKLHIRYILMPLKKASNFLEKMGAKTGPIGKFAKGLAKVFQAPEGLFRFTKITIPKCLTGLNKFGRAFGKWSGVLNIVFAAVDGFAGFVTTKGNIWQKTLGGLHRAIIGFFTSITELIQDVLWAAGKLTGQDWLVKASDGIKNWNKSLRSGIGYDPSYGTGPSSYAKTSNNGGPKDSQYKAPSGLVKIDNITGYNVQKDLYAKRVHGSYLKQEAVNEVAKIGHQAMQMGYAKANITGTYSPVNAAWHKDHSTGMALDVVIPGDQNKHKNDWINWGILYAMDPNVKQIIYTGPGALELKKSKYGSKINTSIGGHYNHMHIRFYDPNASAKAGQPKLQKIPNLSKNPPIHENYTPALPKLPKNLAYNPVASADGDQIAMVTQEAAPLSGQVRNLTGASPQQKVASGTQLASAGSSGGSSRPSFGKKSSIDDINLALLQSLVIT